MRPISITGFQAARGKIYPSTCTQNAQERNVHHVKNAISIITPTRPLARVHRDIFTRGGGSRRENGAFESLCTLSRYHCHRTKITIKVTPRVRRAMMSSVILNSQKRKIGKERNIHGVFHFCGAVSPFPSTNTMKTNPVVTRNAPNQSIRRSCSVDGISASKEKMPPIKQRTVKLHDR